ncbi:MAG: hypothetical protein KatS3mg002_0590 [Candidatus Woesearchaeota archaeon]|nr:MAG: hypothetical protein KatS3mg002_0590 [Candidatus Woesearchaeota archaeon]
MNNEEKRQGIPYLINNINEDFDGININLFGLISEYEGKGIAISGVINASDSYNGVSVSGIINYFSKNKGLSVSPLNYSKNAKVVLTQIGLINIVDEEINKDTCVMQLGLYNRIGGRTSPLLNFKNLFRKKPSDLEKIISLKDTSKSNNNITN